MREEKAALEGDRHERREFLKKNRVFEALVGGLSI